MFIFPAILPSIQNDLLISRNKINAAKTVVMEIRQKKIIDNKMPITHNYEG